MGMKHNPQAGLPPMTRVRFTLPQVKLHPDTRPPACPHCGSVFLNRHGAVAKPRQGPLRQPGDRPQIPLRRLPAARSDTIRRAWTATTRA